VIKWLRKKEAKYRSYLAGEKTGRGYRDSAGAFVDWLEETGASTLMSMENPPEVGQWIVAVWGSPLTWMFGGFWADVRRYRPEDALLLDYWQPMPMPPETP